VVIANAQLQLEVSQHHISRFGLIFGQICTAHAHKSLLFPISQLNFLHHHWIRQP